MRRRLAYADFQRRVPRWFGHIEIDADQRVRLAGKPRADAPLSYARDCFVGDRGGVMYDSDDCTVSVRLRGTVCFLLYLRRRRVVSTTFAYNISRQDLREAIVRLRRTDVKPFIESGLRWFVEHAPPPILREDVRPLLPALLKSGSRAVVGARGR